MPIFRRNKPVPDRLMFLHIPKTAGTSVRFVVKDLYADDEIVWIYAGKPWAHVPQELTAMPQPAKESARLVYGHMNYGIHRFFEGPFTYTAVLRDPVDRMISLWYHNVRATERKPAKGTPLNELESMIQTGEMTIRTFAEGVGPADKMANRLTRLLSGRMDGAVDQAMLGEALSNVEREFLGVGFTNNVQAFIDVMATAMGWKGDTTLGKKNTNQRRTAAPDPDPDLIDVFRDRNAIDIELVARIRDMTDNGTRLLRGTGTT